jgi:hypothetical protein
MTEQQIETLEKLFPNGFVCVGIMKNNRIHISYKNPHKSETLGNIEEEISDVITDLQGEQDESN